MCEDNSLEEHDVILGVPLQLDEEYDPSQSRKVRVRAVILLVVFLLPSILIAIEVASGGLSRTWQESIKPFFDNPQILHF
jgi:hypothetical protein